MGNAWQFTCTCEDTVVVFEFWDTCVMLHVVSDMCQGELHVVECGECGEIREFFTYSRTKISPCGG